MKRNHCLPFASLLASFALAAALPAPAMAGPTYSYTGTAMDLVVGDASLLPAGADQISGSITFDDSVTANFTGELDQTKVIAASLSAFGFVLDLTGPTQPQIDFFLTDGVVTDWSFAFYDTYTQGGRDILLATTSANDVFAHFTDAGGGIDVTAVNPNQTSAWTLEQAADVPEPLSAALLLSGLGGIAALRRRRITAAG